MTKTKKKKYYGVYSKENNFLYGAFELNKEGLLKAKKYMAKLSDKKDKKFYIKLK